MLSTTSYLSQCGSTYVLHIGSNRRTVLFLIGLEVFYVHGYPFCDSDCLSIVTSPRHVTHTSVFAFSYAPDNVCHTTLFWVLTSFSSWVLLSDQVSQPYVISGSIHSLNAFLFSLIGSFLSRMMLPELIDAGSVSSLCVLQKQSILVTQLLNFYCRVLKLEVSRKNDWKQVSSRITCKWNETYV